MFIDLKTLLFLPLPFDEENYNAFLNKEGGNKKKIVVYLSIEFYGIRIRDRDAWVAISLD